MEKIAPNSREGCTLLKSIRHQRSQGQAQANHRNSRGEKKRGAVKTEASKGCQNRVKLQRQTEGRLLPAPAKGKGKRNSFKCFKFYFYLCVCLLVSMYTTCVQYPRSKKRIIGAGNPGLCKSSKSAYWMSPLSSPQ